MGLSEIHQIIPRLVYPIFYKIKIPQTLTYVRIYGISAGDRGRTGTRIAPHGILSPIKTYTSILERGGNNAQNHNDATQQPHRYTSLQSIHTTV